MLLSWHIVESELFGMKVDGGRAKLPRTLFQYNIGIETTLVVA